MTFQLGDFDDLRLDEKYDLIFAVETLCHAKDLLKVISTASQSLIDGGKMVIFDAYATAKLQAENGQDHLVNIASALFAQGFVMRALDPLSLYDDVPTLTRLKISEMEDLSGGVLSNFERFQEGVLPLFRYPWVTKWLMRLRIVPKSLFLHGLAGLFGAFLLQNQYICYAKMVLAK